MTSVDIAIPCYQHGRFLPDCVASVTSQGIDRLRVLIVDNASTDGSAEVARRLAAEDRRIEVLARPRNLGPHASFNAGVDWAASEYFMVLCADDLLAPGALRRAAGILDREPGAAFACGSEATWNEGQGRPALPARAGDDWRVQSGDEFLEERCRDPMAGPPAGMVLVRTAAQKRAGHYRPELPYCDDQELLLRLAGLGGVARTASAQGIRRLHGGNMSHGFSRTRLEELRHWRGAFRSFFEHEGARRADRARLERLAGRNFAARAYWWALRELCRGRVVAAAGLLRFVSETSPGPMPLPPLDYLFRDGGRLGQTRPARALARLRAAAGRAA